ncbi:MAG: HEAT repeat domain-containing protein, partial [Gemmataceae bacterium]
MIRVALILFCLMGMMTPLRADEPQFQGQSQSRWLTQLKEDTLPRKRRAAVIALGQIASDHKDSLPTVIPALAKALRNEVNPGVRTQLGLVLGQQPAEASGLFLVELAEAIRTDKDETARKTLITAAGRYGKAARPAVLPLIEALSD